MRQYRITIKYGKYRNFEIHLEVQCKFWLWTWWDIESIRTGNQSDMIDYCIEWQKEFMISANDVIDETGEVIV